MLPIFSNFLILFYCKCSSRKFVHPSRFSVFFILFEYMNSFSSFLQFCRFSILVILFSEMFKKTSSFIYRKQGSIDCSWLYASKQQPDRTVRLRKLWQHYSNPCNVDTEVCSRVSSMRLFIRPIFYMFGILVKAISTTCKVPMNFGSP